MFQTEDTLRVFEPYKATEDTFDDLIGLLLGTDEDLLLICTEIDGTLYFVVDYEFSLADYNVVWWMTALTGIGYIKGGKFPIIQHPNAVS